MKKHNSNTHTLISSKVLNKKLFTAFNDALMRLDDYNISTTIEEDNLDGYVNIYHVYKVKKDSPKHKEAIYNKINLGGETLPPRISE